MSSQTTNYKLIIPEGQDNADISVVGENMEIIDAQLKKISDEKLAKTGGEITGDLTVKKSYPGIYLANDAVDREFRAILFDNNGNIEVSNYKDTSNYQGVRVMKETADIKTAVKLMRAKEGVFSEYNLYGEHNKPTAADVGAVPAINANSASFNMDNVIKSGAHLAMYITGNNTLGTPQKYGKTALVSAAILSYGIEADYGVQVAFLSGGGVMTRGLSKGVLSEWTAFYHEGNAAAIVADATLEE